MCGAVVATESGRPDLCATTAPINYVKAFDERELVLLVIGGAFAA